MADKKISEMTTASQINNEDNIELSQGSAGSGFASVKATILAIAQKIITGINFTSALETESKTIAGAINEVAQGGGGYTEVTGALTAGQTEIVLLNSSITQNSTIEPFTDKFGVKPTNMIVSAGSVTLTFPAQSENLNVKVRVS